MRPSVFFTFGFCLLMVGCKLNVSYVGEGVISTTDDVQLNTDCGTQADLCASTSLSQSIILTAAPKEGYSFVGWEGDCEGVDTCVLKMSGSRQVSAFFAPVSDANNYFLLKPGNGIFFASPWPSDTRLNDKGFLDVANFPFEKDGAWAKQLSELASQTPGFSTNGAIFLRTAKPLSDFAFENLPTDTILLFEVDNPEQQTPVSFSLFLSDSDPRRSNLIAIQPLDTLKPSTRYALVVKDSFNAYGSNQITASPLLERIKAGSDLDARESAFRELFDSLRAPLAQLGLSDDNVLTFTVFTTQDPGRYHRLVSNTVSGWTDDMVRNRVQKITELSRCDDASGSTRLLGLTVAFPSYLSGKPPFTTGGGKLVIENDRLIEQAKEVFDLYVRAPCRAPAQIDKMGVIIEAAETATNSGPYLFNNAFTESAIRLMVDAPYSAPQRQPALGGLIETILDLADIDSYSLFETLSHFNPFNLESNLGLHYQYSIDLLFAKKVASQLETLIPEYLPVPIDPMKIGYTGESFGTIAAMHAASVDQDTVSLNLSELARLSYLSINHLVENNTYIPDALVEFIGNYVGVALPGSEADPTYHLLQTALEPLDLMNFVSDYDHIPMFLSMDHYGHPFHGGPSSYSLLKALHERAPFNPNFDFSANPDNSYFNEVAQDLEVKLGWVFTPMEDMNLAIFGPEPLRLLIPDEVSDDDECFHYEVFYNDTIDSNYRRKPPCIRE